MWLEDAVAGAAVVVCVDHHVAEAIVTGWASARVQLAAHHAVAAYVATLRVEIRRERDGRHVQALACYAHVDGPCGGRLPVEIHGAGAARAALLPASVGGSVPRRAVAVVENDPDEVEDEVVSVTCHAPLVKDLDDLVHALRGVRPDGKAMVLVLLG